MSTDVTTGRVDEPLLELLLVNWNSQDEVRGRDVVTRRTYSGCSSGGLRVAPLRAWTVIYPRFECTVSKGVVYDTPGLTMAR